MADTTFIDFVTPTVNAEWLNEVNDHLWSDTPVSGTTVHNSAAIKFIPSGTGAVATTVQAKLQESVSVLDFIPSAEHQAILAGTSTYNCTDAMAAASAHINSLGGGKLIIPRGIYIVGKQDFAGAFGLGYAYKRKDILKFVNCTRPVIVEGEGSIIRIANNLSFGSFDPVTGAVFNPTLPFTDQDYAGNAYIVIEASGNKSLTIRDLEIDGNIQNVRLGGQWGDTGYQLPGDGIRAYGNENLLIENVHSHHCYLDGLHIGYAGLTEVSPQFPQTLINVVSEYNARQGLSWVGGTQLTAINCKFNHTGKSTFSSAPSAGVDIEAEASVCRNGLFINCEMQNNSSNGIVADSGDSADVVFLRCKFVGQSSYVIWPNKPRFSFIDCTIVGSYVNPFASSTKPEDATKFTRCLFTDEDKYATTLANIGTLNSLLSGTSAQQNVLYDSCNFVVTRSKAGRFDGAILRNTNFEIQAGTSFCSNQDWFMILWGTRCEGITIQDNITTDIPVDAFYVGLDSTSLAIGKNIINSSASKLKWANWSWGAAGDFQASPPTVDGIRFNAIAGNNGGNGVRFVGYRDAVPASGTWVRGDRIFNNAPAVGQPKSWACTESGTPGTWVSEGNL